MTLGILVIEKKHKRKMKKFEQSAHMIQAVEFREMEPKITIFVYPLPEDASLTNWKIESLPLVFKPE